MTLSSGIASDCIECPSNTTQLETKTGVTRFFSSADSNTFVMKVLIGNELKSESVFSYKFSLIIVINIFTL